MADDLNSSASAAESPAAIAPLGAATLPHGGRRPEEQPTHRFRFGFAYLALAAILGAAVGTTILLMGRPADKTVQWSSWKPTATGGFAIQEIANHVGGKYRLDNNRQLLVAIPGPPSITDGDSRIPVSGVAMRAPIVRGAEDFSFTPMNNGLMYLLCGDESPRCGALSGRRSNATDRLVRREGLELALYTFKYVDGIDSILTFMPPVTGSQSTHALFYRRSDLTAQLARPVTDTLRARPRLRAIDLDPIEGVVVDRLTLPHLFQTTPTQGQDGSVFLMLDPLGS